MSAHRVPTILWVLALAAATLIAEPSAAKSRSVSVKRDLAPTGVDADARGETRLFIRARSGGLDGKLEVQVRHLDRRSTYDVSLDGIRIGSLTTGRSGSGRARFRSSPRGRDQLLGADPRGRAIVISGSAGAVLGVTVPDDSIDASKIRCCLPDDSGPECEDRTSAECITQGGDDLGPGTCLPNPCEGVTPPPSDADIRCCLPDDSGAECEDRTPAECAAQVGVNLGAGSCVPNPCSARPTPPPPGGGSATARVTCEVRASRSKISVDGSNLTAGTYSARVVSGANEAVSHTQSTIGDEAEFDFDSDPGDIAAGATPIAADFIEGTPPEVSAQILDAQGGVVAEATVTCGVR